MKRFIVNPLWARQLGENGWKVAREKFSAENYAAKINIILKKISRPLE